eukprot:TRINITY_DN81289_c0_g1_i1.p1 TRINITY_DN81289_c0_g1~~TRINITY_DN81289_c0_g1_i1.p1  ORF type:complete len:529 (-),score=42.87 TRINITY_DN81289_c0_g1_i1:21-1556(-)
MVLLLVPPCRASSSSSCQPLCRERQGVSYQLSSYNPVSGVGIFNCWSLLTRGTCDPYFGDLPCGTMLSVLCFDGTKLAVTEPIRGYNVDPGKICSKFGPGWAVFEFHQKRDPNIGSQVVAQVLPSTYLKEGQYYWIRIDTTSGECWDPAQSCVPYGHQFVATCPNSSTCTFSCDRQYIGRPNVEVARCLPDGSWSTLPSRGCLGTLPPMASCMFSTECASGGCFIAHDGSLPVRWCMHKPGDTLDPARQRCAGVVHTPPPRVVPLDTKCKQGQTPPGRPCLFDPQCASGPISQTMYATGSCNQTILECSQVNVRDRASKSNGVASVKAHTESTDTADEPVAYNAALEIMPDGVLVVVFNTTVVFNPQAVTVVSLRITTALGQPREVYSLQAQPAGIEVGAGIWANLYYHVVVHIPATTLQDGEQSGQLEVFFQVAPSGYQAIKKTGVVSLSYSLPVAPSLSILRSLPLIVVLFAAVGVPLCGFAARVLRSSNRNSNDKVIVMQEKEVIVEM